MYKKVTKWVLLTLVLFGVTGCQPAMKCVEGKLYKQHGNGMWINYGDLCLPEEATYTR